MLMCLLYSFIFSKIPPKLQYVIGLFVSSIGLAFMSDSTKYLGMYDSVNFIFIGLAIIGMGNILSFIPNTPEVINLMICKYKIVEGINDDLVARMNDSASSLYQISYNLGGMISPIIGAALYDLFGYEVTMLIIASFMLIMSIIYLIFNAGPKVFKNYNDVKKMLDHL